MSKNKLFKIIIAVLIAIALFVVLTQNSFSTSFVGDISNKFNGRLDKSDATNTVGTIIAKAINVLQVIGMGVAILMLVITGIRWVGASPSGKANLKKESTYYVMGAVFIFAAMGLLEIIKRFSNATVNSV